MSNLLHFPTGPRVVADLDDLYDADQLKLFDHILEARPDFKVTLFAIPNKLGPVHKLKQEFPWVTFGIHGWEHTRQECLTWSPDLANYYLTRALELGYDPIFRPPNWVADTIVEDACLALNIVFAHHANNYYGPDTPRTPGLMCYPGPPELRKDQPTHAWIHSHLTPNPATDDLFTSKHFRVEELVKYGMFRNLTDYAVTIPEEE